jgi:hypothetical protein
MFDGYEWVYHSVALRPVQGVAANNLVVAGSRQVVVLQLGDWAR